MESINISKNEMKKMEELLVSTYTSSEGDVIRDVNNSKRAFKLLFEREEHILAINYIQLIP